MERSKIKKLLTLDYALIDEAMRRLEDGTCCLIDEDKMSAMDLFGRMHLALINHISFENQALPLIAEYFKNSDKNSEVKNLCSKMKEEHEYLGGLLEAARRELNDTHPVAFREVLKALKTGLQKHLELEILIPYDQWIESLNAEALAQIERTTRAGII